MDGIESKASPVLSSASAFSCAARPTMKSQSPRLSIVVLVAIAESTNHAERPYYKRKGGSSLEASPLLLQSSVTSRSVCLHPVGRIQYPEYCARKLILTPTLAVEVSLAVVHSGRGVVVLPTLYFRNPQCSGSVK